MIHGTSGFELSVPLAYIETTIPRGVTLAQYRRSRPPRRRHWLRVGPRARARRDGITPSFAALTAGHDEDLHPRRLPRHAAHARLLHEAVGARRRGLERPRPGRRRARRAIARDRSARAHSRAHRDPRVTPPSTAEAAADQPAQRLPAHRCRRLHGARGGRLVEHACGDAVVRRGGAHLGARARGNASASPTGRRPQGRDMAGRRRPHAPRQDARRLRLRKDRRRGRRVRAGVRSVSQLADVGGVGQLSHADSSFSASGMT